MERFNERNEREDRRKNIVRKGARWGTGKIEQEFIKTQLRCEISMNKTFKVNNKENKSIVVAHLGTRSLLRS